MDLKGKAFNLADFKGKKYLSMFGQAGVRHEGRNSFYRKAV
jgi:hypothetical protein